MTPTTRAEPDLAPQSVDPAAAFVASVRDVLCGVVSRLDPVAAQHLGGMVVRGGHGFRPRLLREVAIARSADVEIGRVLKLAAAVELLHIASLVHDDFSDRSPRRRGMATPRAGAGSEATLLIGTTSAIEGIKLARDIGSGFARAFIDGAVRLADGQLSDVQRALAPAISPEEYLDLVRAKTGSLMASAILLGAVAAREVSMAESAGLTDLGELIGIAFQIADDIEDAVGATDGKPAHTDDANGVGLARIVDRGQPMSVTRLRAIGLSAVEEAMARWQQMLGSAPAQDGVLRGLRDRLTLR